MNLGALFQATFKERTASLSEPDVILIGSTALVIVEAKFASPNDRQPGKKVDTYPARSWFRASVDEIAQAGYYELTRNWAIGGILADKLDRRFTLVNLVREGQEEQIETSFRPLISDKGIFRRLTWESLATFVEPALMAHLQDETLYFERAFPTLALPGAKPRCQTTRTALIRVVVPESGGGPSRAEVMPRSHSTTIRARSMPQVPRSRGLSTTSVTFCQRVRHASGRAAASTGHSP